MFLNIFLCSSVFVVVYANNIIPVQTYPVYQQNGYMNPIVNQPTNFNTYIPSATVQNQLQQLNISPSSIKQALLNKLLTGAPVQINLNPSTPSYGMNLGNVQSNQIPNNFISNHVAVPTEYWKNRVIENNGKPVIESKSNEHSNQNNKKKLKSKRKKKDDDFTEDSLQKSTVDQQKINKKKRKENLQSSRYTEDSEPESRGIKNARTKSRKKKEKEQIKESPVEIIEQNTKRPRKKKSKVKEQVTEKNNPENRVTNITKQKGIKENTDLDITNYRMDNENRPTRNSKHELNEAIRSIPNTPQEITNHYLSNLNQLNNPLMSNWFANYENLYKSLLANQTSVSTETKPKRRKKNKRNRKNKKKKKNIQNRNSTAETNSNDINIISANFTTTELYPDPIVESFKPFETDEKSLKYSSNEIFQDGYSLNEFDDAYESGPYDGYIDDYYPLFTDSAAYTANNKEVIVKNLNDNNFFYATDETTHIPLKHTDTNCDLSEETANDYEEDANINDDIEKVNISDNYIKDVDYEVTETDFRSPPFLESPDFKTRQIDKSEIKPEIDYSSGDSISRYVGDKSFSAKTANFNGAKRNGIKTPPKDIETVYAKSKVAAYGPVYIPEDIGTADAYSSPWEHSLESNSYQSDGTTYIVAKSFNDDEVW